MTTPTPTPGAASDASQPSDDLLSADDVARTLGVTKQTVSRLIRTGALPAEKVGNKWVIFADKLGAYLAENNLVPEPADHPRRPASPRYPPARPAMPSHPSPAKQAPPATQSPPHPSARSASSPALLGLTWEWSAPASTPRSIARTTASAA